MSARMPGRKQLRPLWRGQGGQGPSWPNIDNDMEGRWRQRQQKRAKPSLAKSQGLSFFLDAVTRNVDAENDMKNMLEKRSQSQPISLFQIVQTGAISKSSFAASVCICNMINMINMCLPPRPLESPSRTTAGNNFSGSKKLFFFPRCSYETQTSLPLQKNNFSGSKKLFFSHASCQICQLHLVSSFKLAPNYADACNTKLRMP